MDKGRAEVDEAALSRGLGWVLCCRRPGHGGQLCIERGTGSCGISSASGSINSSSRWWEAQEAVLCAANDSVDESVGRWRGSLAKQRLHMASAGGTRTPPRARARAKSMRKRCVVGFRVSFPDSSIDPPVAQSSAYCASLHRLLLAEETPHDLVPWSMCN